jgi:hypothetical protein
MDIDANLAEYLADRQPTERYASFDYCFNHFQSYREHGRSGDLAQGLGLEVSCLQLGFYLASWGMYRGSAKLLGHSLARLAPVVEVIADSATGIWEADADDYGDPVCDELLHCADRLRQALPHPASDTLVTKIMLGVFGCVPAFDTYFVAGSGLRTFNRRSLFELGRFYRTHRQVIERNRIKTLDFATGQLTARRYSRAKVIDMIFFTEGSHQTDKRHISRAW